MIETLIARLEEMIRLFAAYEEEIWPDQFEKGIGVVRDLQTALEQIHTRSIALNRELLKPHAPAEAPIDRTALSGLMIEAQYARQKADDARLLLAAYQPYGRSKARTHLQDRQSLVKHLRKLVEVTSQVQRFCTAFESGVRPAHLQVVTATANDAREEQQS